MLKSRMWLSNRRSPGLPGTGRKEKKNELDRSFGLEERTGAPSCLSSRSGRFDGSFILLLLIVPCAIVAISQRQRIFELEEEIDRYRELCNIHKSTFMEFNHRDSFDSRTLALYCVFLSLVMPFLLLKWLDHLPQLKILRDLWSSEKGVPLKKRIAYRADVFFSVHPYAKLLALLFATVLLIGFGGLALYAVSRYSLYEALWLSWTFVADSGNHADQVGLGARIVSVSITSGGMLIFAMMLGLVSDAISEKVDSWRKGKSEVIEKDHILVLGWSDKLRDRLLHPMQTRLTPYLESQRRTWIIFSLLARYLESFGGGWVHGSCWSPPLEAETFWHALHARARQRLTWCVFPTSFLAGAWVIWLQRNQINFYGEHTLIDTIVFHVSFLLG